MTCYEIFGILCTAIITLRAALYDSSVAARCFNDESNNYYAKSLAFSASYYASYNWSIAA